MTPTVRCPQCGAATVAVMDDVTVWSKVTVRDGGLRRGKVVRRGAPREQIGKYINPGDDLVCFTDGCGWMGHRNAVVLGDQDSASQGRNHPSRNAPEEG